MADAAAGTLRLFADGAPLAVQAAPFEVGDADADGVPDLMVRFDGRAFSAALAQYPGLVEVGVVGYLSDGSAFVGGDVVRVNG